MTLTLPMPVRRVVAHAGVKDDEGKVALQRGPLVYAFEAWTTAASVSDLTLPRGIALTSRVSSPICWAASRGLRHAGRPFVAVPYYAWDNRGQGEMAVWIKQ